ncbi:hypothetical protein [Chitinophaga pinensis]|uniref:hypothetical protein n=1 Tax=Chitinophaga pinensis TaxID=79329 RepID=UPI001C993B6A|nr:hypothetical protein [Chitinophaga pinensis]
MKRYIIGIISLLVVSASACKKELNVGNPNLPTVDQNVTNEAGLVSLAIGAVYVNGFQKGDVWLGDSYFAALRISELLADMVGAQSSNQLVSTISIPEFVLVTIPKNYFHFQYQSVESE